MLLLFVVAYLSYFSISYLNRYEFQENLASKPQTQKREEKKRQSKLKEAADLESALEAFGIYVQFFIWLL